ncbi:MAG: Crp/Fnr family transcriptional regulator [Solirubrobacteraceae bacterium MAG38_C4-C5]|nr:Crp/Fnr family transcriptional regulator [Candidatus Siliceabacter maunaloa]
MSRGGRPTIQVLAADPGLGTDLTPEQLREARVHAVAAQHSVSHGPWERDGFDAPQPGLAGLLVIEGVILRDVQVGRFPAAELLGPGDLLRPWQRDEGYASVPAHTTWTALSDVRFAVLDRDYMHATARWPELAASLVCRAVDRSRATVFSFALTNLPHLDERLLGLLWALADRWGRVRRDGVVVPFRLDHDVLGRLVSARRPSISRTTGHLAQRGILRRTTQRHWILTGDPPNLPLPALHADQ